MRHEQHPHTARRRRGPIDAVIACAAVGLFGAVVGGLAWSRPTTTTATLRYVQTGSLTYSAAVSPTSIYGPAGLSAGQPVYTDAVSALDVSYAYRLMAGVPAHVSGTEQLVATVSGSQGIDRVLPLQSPSTFTGDHVVATAVVNLPALEAAAASLSAPSSSGPEAPQSATVTITPTVRVHGTLGGHRIVSTFDPATSFALTTAALTPSTAGSPQAGTGAAKLPSATQSGAVTVAGGRPATWLLGWTVWDIRIEAVVLFLLGVAGMVAIGLPLARDATSSNEDIRITARHGSALVEVDGFPDGPDVAVVDVSSFDGLVKVARRLECPLLHASGAAHIYGVVDNGTLYRYQSRPVRARRGARSRRATSEGGRQATGDGAQRNPARIL